MPNEMYQRNLLPNWMYQRNLLPNNSIVDWVTIERVRIERFFFRGGYNWKGENASENELRLQSKSFLLQLYIIRKLFFTQYVNIYLCMLDLPIKAGLARALKSSIFLSGSVIVSHLRGRINFKTVLPAGEWQKVIMSDDGLASVTDTLTHFLTICRDQTAMNTTKVSRLKSWKRISNQNITTNCSCSSLQGSTLAFDFQGSVTLTF